MEFNYTRVMFSAWKYSFGGSAQEQENWVLKPVNDPGRLRRLRCAFQLAVNAHSGVERTLNAAGAVNEFKVTTRENIKLAPIPKEDRGFAPKILDFMPPRPTQRVIPQGPVFEPRRDDTFPSSAIQGLIQLQQN